VDLTKRFDNLKNGVNDIKGHISGLHQQIGLPCSRRILKLRSFLGAKDTSNFDEYEEALRISSTENCAFIAVIRGPLLYIMLP